LKHEVFGKALFVSLDLLIKTLCGHRVDISQVGVENYFAGTNQKYCRFDWIVFDPQNSVLGLELSVVPEPSTYAIMLLGLALVGWRLRRARPR